MCCDLNRCVYYSDAAGVHLDADAPVRPVLTILDGIVAGEGNGPLAPLDVPLGVILASLDPVALDLVAERKIPKVSAPMASEDLRVTSVRSPADVEVGEAVADSTELRVYGLDAIVPRRTFVAHPGWLDHIERRADAPQDDEEPQRASA